MKWRFVEKKTKPEYMHEASYEVTEVQISDVFSGLKIKLETKYNWI